MQALRKRLEAVVASQAAALGCTASVDWMQETMPYYPPTVNDAEVYKFAADVATRCSGRWQCAALRLTRLCEAGGRCSRWGL